MDKRDQEKLSISRMFLYALLVIFAVMCLYPLLWLLINSFKSSSELFINPWGLPKAATLENYINAWTVGNVGRYFVNSFSVTLISCLSAIILSAMAAYAITRIKWKLSKYVLMVFLIGVMVPIHSTLIPLFTMFQKIKITNSFLALILPYVAFALPTSIFILSGFF